MDGVDMTGYAFYSVRDDELKSHGVEPMPMPVRKEMEAEVFEGGRVRLELLVNELLLFLDSLPALTPIYAPTMEAMSLLAGMDREMEGDGDAAIRCLETGLAANPGSLLLRSSYAMALHFSGRWDKAGEQYEMALADPGGREDPVLCLLAARLFIERGEYLEAYRLLEGQATRFPPEDAFWEFLAELRDLAGVKDGEKGRPAGLGEEDTPPPACGTCGAPMLAGERFCASCGGERLPSSARSPSCPACGKKMLAGERFCASCGSPAGGEGFEGVTCPGCGLQQRQGARFCKRCGRPQ